jgi:hypothetical protein
VTTFLVTAHLIAALNQHPTVPSWVLEEEAPPAPALGPTRTGRATRYGHPATFNGNRMGCGGTYWSWDTTILAVPPSLYRTYPCGTTLQVTGPYGTLIGTRRDSCPGCDAYGIVVDMADAGHRIVCGPGTCTVTVQEVLSSGGRGWRELAL